MKNRPEQKIECQCRVPRHGVLVFSPAKRAAVVAGAGRVGVVHFAESVRAAVVQCRRLPHGAMLAQAVKPRMMTVRIRIVSMAAFTS